MSDKEMYDDLYIRDELADDGSYPNGLGGGCPDMVPRQVAWPGDVRKLLIDKYGEDLGQNVVIGKDNFLYGRVKNLHKTEWRGGDPESSLNVYFMEISTYLHPEIWMNNRIASFPLPSIGPGRIEAAGSSSRWSPGALKTPYPHHCLVGQVVTRQHKNEIPKTSDFEEFWRWVRGNPAIA